MDSARAVASQLSLEGRAELIRCPLLVVMGKLDRLVRWTQAARLAEEAASRPLLLLDKGNHGCANLSPFHRYLTADWVAERLGEPTRRARPASLR